MSKVFVGSNGSFRSAWQLWKRRNHEPESFVFSYKDIVVFKSSDEEGSQYVWYVGVVEDELPEGVYVDGVTARDTRS